MVDDRIVIWHEDQKGLHEMADAIRDGDVPTAGREGMKSILRTAAGVAISVDKNIYCGSFHCRGGHKWVSGQWRLDSINCGAVRDRTDEELAAANRIQQRYLEDNQ